jgi:hypothetical protein
MLDHVACSDKIEILCQLLYRGVFNLLAVLRIVLTIL